MSAERLYSEIFDEFNKCTNRAERIALLRKYDHKHFRAFLILMLNPNIEFDVKLPETYRPAPEPAGLNYTYLSSEVPKMYRFIKAHPQRNPNLSDRKKTELIRVILESLHKDEARVLVELIQKQLKVKFLTPELVREAFPDISR